MSTTRTSDYNQQQFQSTDDNQLHDQTTTSTTKRRNEINKNKDGKNNITESEMVTRKSPTKKDIAKNKSPRSKSKGKSKKAKSTKTGKKKISSPVKENNVKKVGKTKAKKASVEIKSVEVPWTRPKRGKKNGQKPTTTKSVEGGVVKGTRGRPRKPLDVAISYLQQEKTKEKRPKTIPCEHEGCEKLFRRISDMRRHQLSHLGQQPYKCPWVGCEKRFQQTHSLTVHMRNHKGERPFACTVDGCNASFNYLPVLIRHRRGVHHDSLPYKCDVDGCADEFSDGQQLKSHKDTIHAAIKIYACGYEGCDWTTTRRYQVTVHERLHTGEKPYQCGFPGCGKSFIYQNMWKKHMDGHSKKVPLPITSNSLSDLAAVVGSIERPNLPASSTAQGANEPVCVMALVPTEDNQLAIVPLPVLKKKLKLGPTFTCPYAGCGRTYKSRYYRRHMQVHTTSSRLTKGEKPHECEICQKRFNRVTNLTHHMRIHTGENPYECEKCHEKFPGPYQLKMHRKNHDVEKPPFYCTWEGCNKTVRRKYDLRKHLLSHTGELPYQCVWPGCDKRFQQAHSLVVHTRNHKGIRPYKCNWPGCDKAFNYAPVLSRHKKLIHKVTNETAIIPEEIIIEIQN